MRCLHPGNGNVCAILNSNSSRWTHPSRSQGLTLLRDFKLNKYWCIIAFIIHLMCLRCWEGTSCRTPLIASFMEKHLPWANPYTHGGPLRVLNKLKISISSWDWTSNNECPIISVFSIRSRDPKNGGGTRLTRRRQRQGHQHGSTLYHWWQAE